MNTGTKPHNSFNIASALIKLAAVQGDNVAIHYPVGKHKKQVSFEAVTYAALNELSDDYARGLCEYGIGRGVRTALMLTPGLDFFAMFFRFPHMEIGDLSSPLCRDCHSQQCELYTYFSKNAYLPFVEKLS